MSTVDLADIIDILPRFLTNKDIERFFKGIISPRDFANLKSNGAGPAKTYIGRKVVYRREDIIKWLQSI